LVLAVAIDFTLRMAVADLPFTLSVNGLRDVTHDETAQLSAHHTSVATG
jgi:hypothetical protein